MITEFALFNILISKRIRSTVHCPLLYNCPTSNSAIFQALKNIGHWFHLSNFQSKLIINRIVSLTFKNNLVLNDFWEFEVQKRYFLSEKKAI